MGLEPEEILYWATVECTEFALIGYRICLTDVRVGNKRSLSPMYKSRRFLIIYWAIIRQMRSVKGCSDSSSYRDMWKEGVVLARTNRIHFYKDLSMLDWRTNLVCFCEELKAIFDFERC